ncbi:hypothetical protein FACS1894211_01330 [Clostridia bacterium]|nr:hypothetical protein FACS1894211_01330 [Clostridia bacterium]
MTNRERALNILRYKKTDRMPAIHFGYWNELLAEWAEQGHLSMELARAWEDGNAADREIDKLLGWDATWACTVSAFNGLWPAFEYKELEKTADGFTVYVNGSGLIEKKRAGAAGIPAEVDYLLKDRAAWEELYKPKMQFKPERVDIGFFKKFNDSERDYPAGLFLGSVLGAIRDMLSVVGMSYMIADDYDLFAEIIDTYADMQYKCAEAVLALGVQFDFGHYWEDICFKNGPLISPVMFEELCAKHYKKRNELCKKYGLDIISLDCDGVTERLLPVWFANGVNTMFPIEIGTWGDQFAPARQKFGKGMLGVGGMDKTALRKDRAAVDAELERIRGLAALGGFIPCPDHRLMPGTKWDLVRYYTDKIKEMKV